MKRMITGLSLVVALTGLTMTTGVEADETQRVGDMPKYVGDIDYYDQGAPVGDSLASPAYQRQLSNGNDCGCSSPACGGGCGMSRGTIGAGICNPDTWLSAELLLWFPQARSAPPLLATSPTGGLPVIGQPGYQTVFGEELGNGLVPGFRADAGRYFRNGQYGLGARVWVLAEDDETFAGNTVGQPSLGRPFFNTTIGTEDSLLIGFDPVVGTGFEGSVDAASGLEIVASELYGRMLFGQGQEFRMDLIGGYSFFNIEDDLHINSTSIRTSDGLTRSFRDSFNTENAFHGGQIGFDTTVHRGRWSASSLTKVHLGNMNQRVAIRGSSERSIIGVPGVDQFSGGLLAMDNQGVRERDVFAFAPEVNFKLGYRVRNYVTFTVGYSFIYWDRVALAGDQIDRNVDVSGLLTNAVTVAEPSFNFNDRGLWVQGVDLGMAIEY